MGDGNNDHVSMPQRTALQVLCIDGTLAVDSAAFIYYLGLAGTKQGVAIENILTHVTTKTMPISKQAFKDGKRLRTEQVLLPQGEVDKGGKTNSFLDSTLGTDQDQRRDKAIKNSERLRELCFAPGVSKDGELGFASDVSTSANILYLSGHGSMSGVVCGEEPSYINFFELLSTLRKDFPNRIPADSIAPYWMIVASCFSLRPVFGEVWLRFFRRQDHPLRGILGYQMTSPLAVNSVPINQKFCNALASGKTFLEAWATANGGNQRWTALAFKHAERDTLVSLADLKKNELKSAPTKALAQEKEELYFTAQGHPLKKVTIEPPRGLLVVHRWNGAWNKLLITNLDFTEEMFTKQAKPGLVTNGSWQACKDPRSLTEITGDWEHELKPGGVYRVDVFPPFIESMKQGFQADDQIEVTVVHVRNDYPTQVAFAEQFELVQVNGLADISKATFNKNQIRYPCPTSPLFRPASFTVRFKSGTKPLLWFWFGVKIMRNGQEVFRWDFDAFILTIDSSPAPRVELPPDVSW